MSWFIAAKTLVGMGVGPGIIRLYFINFLLVIWNSFQFGEDKNIITKPRGKSIKQQDWR